MKKVKKFLLILIISILLFELIISNSCISYAADGAEFAVGNKVANLITNLGGGIISILVWIPKLKATAILIVIDFSISLLSKIGATTQGAGFFITPYDIFFNKFKLLDVNFFDLGVDDDTIIYEIRTHVAEWYYAMRLIAAAILLVVLIYVGIRMALASVADEKAKYKKMLWDWCCSLALIFVIQYIAIFVIYFNNAAVNALDSAFSNVGAEEAIGGLALEALVGVGLRSIVAFLVFVGILAQTIFFFIGYFNRVLKVGFLLLISPLITLTYSIDKMGDGKAQALGNWLKEFIFTVLIQPFHCIVYMSFINVAFKLVGFKLDLNYVNNLFNVNQLAQGFLAILCIKFVNDGEKIVRKIFGFADDNSKTSFAAGAVATVAAVKTASNIGDKASKVISNSKVSIAKFGEHLDKDSGKLKEMFGDKVPKGAQKALSKGANKLKNFGTNSSKKKKNINGKKTSKSGKFMSKHGSKIRDSIKKRANHLTVAAVAGMAAYATGSTDAMTALGVGYAAKKTADGLFNKTTTNLMNKDAKTNLDEDKREFDEKKKALGESLESAQEKLSHFDETVKNYQEADTMESKADDIEKQAEQLDDQIKKSPNDPDIDKKKQQLKDMRDKVKELRKGASDKRAKAQEKDTDGKIKDSLDKGESDEFKKSLEEIANFWEKDSIIKRLSGRHQSNIKKDLENKSNEIQQEIVSILRKRRGIDLADDSEELPEEYLTAEDTLGKSLTKILVSKAQANLWSEEPTDSKDVLSEMGFEDDEKLNDLFTEYEQILAVNQFSENTSQSEDFGYTENGYFNKVAEKIYNSSSYNRK